jgi:RNA polymerase sigma-70 factor (ECF subfamily)
VQESALIAALKAGDPAAQEALVQAYRRRLLATAWHFLGPQDPDAEDVVQDTLMAAFKSIAGFEGRSSLYTWLNHICVNHCFSLLRKRKRLVATEAQDLERLVDGGATARAEEEAQLARRRRELLKGWIEGMDGLCREILSLRFLGGLPLAEIKEKLRVPLGTVASRLRRCQLSLQEKARQS